jgi:ATP-dependent DNA ligase
MLPGVGAAAAAAGLVCGSLARSGTALFQAIREHATEGIVAKLANGAYTP